MLYMVKKKTGYFFRLRFPKDVAGYFGRTEIIRSLHTSRYSEAKRLVTSYAAKAERVFTMIRSGSLDDDVIKKIANEFLEMAYTAAEKYHNQELVGAPPCIQHDMQQYRQALTAVQDYDYTRKLAISKDQLADLAVKNDVELQDGFEILHKVSQDQHKELKRIKARDKMHEEPIIKEMAAFYLEKYGIAVDENNDKYRALCRELFRVEMQIDETLSAWQQGEETDLDQEMRVKRSCKTLSALIQQYEDEKRESWSDPARMQSAHRQILHILGDIRLNKIDRAMMIQFREDLKRYPCNLRGKAFDTPWQELSARAKRFLSDASQQFVLSELNTLLSHGGGIYNMGVQGTPGKGLMKAKKDLERVKNRVAYTTEELKRMVDALSRVQRDKYPDTFWIPLLLLYTGARSNDICMLRCADVEQHGDIVLLMFRYDKAQGQRTKSEEDRQIPVHRHLLQIGFLEYVTARREAGHDRLFPLKEYRGKWNKAYGKAFNRTFKHKFLQGYTDEELSEKDLHTFRKTFIGWYVRNVLVGNAGDFITNLATLQSMIGHLETDELKGIIRFIDKSSITIEDYGDGLAGVAGNTQEQLVLLERLDYGLDLSSLLPAS